MAKMTYDNLQTALRWLSSPEGKAALERAGVLEPDQPEQVERMNVYIDPEEIVAGGGYIAWSYPNKMGMKQLREVLPGDPEPDELVWTEEQVREVIDEMILKTMDSPYAPAQLDWYRAFGLEE